MNFKSINFVTLPLTRVTKGQEEVPFRSGLNWGQRPGRNLSQAYLSIPVEVQRSDFFPDIGVEFDIICDDGFEMKCRRTQQNGKALCSSESNAILGDYFRKRLAIEPGDLVTVKHLSKYGRHNVDIHKRQDKPYFLDFSIRG